MLCTRLLCVYNNIAGAARGRDSDSTTTPEKANCEIDGSVTANVTDANTAATTQQSEVNGIAS
jgi:hypothetical protein